MDATNLNKWAKLAVQAFLLRCWRNLAFEAQTCGDIKLAQRFIALACGLDEGSP